MILRSMKLRPTGLFVVCVEGSRLESLFPVQSYVAKRKAGFLFGVRDFVSVALLEDMLRASAQRVLNVFFFFFFVFY